jgi:hypothetical protein
MGKGSKMMFDDDEMPPTRVFEDNGEMPPTLAEYNERMRDATRNLTDDPIGAHTMQERTDPAAVPDEPHRLRNDRVEGERTKPAVKVIRSQGGPRAA